MAWFAVVEKATGRLLSTGTVVAASLPDTVEVLPIDEQPGEMKEWDAATKTLKDRPVEAPRLDQFLGDSIVGTLLQKLNAADRQALRNKLEAYLR